MVFGTYFLPSERVPATTGIGMPSFPQTFAAQLAAPVRWRHVSRPAPQPA